MKAAVAVLTRFSAYDQTFFKFMSCLVYICGAGAIGGIEFNFKAIEQSVLSCYDVGKFYCGIKKPVLKYFIIDFIHIYPLKNKKSKKTDKIAIDNFYQYIYYKVCNELYQEL